jgi:predicted GNAT family N-acyltransferase
MEVEITEVLFGSELYEQSKQFRDQVLRRPIGLTLSAQDIAGEERQIHIVAINAEDKEIVGCVRFAETLAQARGYKEIELNARVSAQVFYEKLGYEVCGEPFVEVTLPTILMTRALH